MRSISTKALFSTLFFLLTCLIANSATHNITRRSSRDRSHRKKCPISSSPLQCSHQIIPPTPTAPPPDLPNPEQLLSFADQRLQMVYPIIQKFKSIITSDPRNITKTWVGSDICNYRGFYCDNPPYNSSAIALASIDFNGFQLGASSLDGFLDQLPDIALFHANSNNFSGTISSKIASLPYLYEFDISNNQFSGPFPTALLGMNSLTFLDVRFNFFTGSVPPQIFTQDLDALFLNNNDFMASLPDNLGSSHIVLLTLANNKFNGPIPRSIAKALSSLTEVLLLNNQLTGCLPYEIGLLKEAIVFDASNNQLTGPLPFSLACLDKVEQLNFAGNLLFGMVPEVICDQLENLAYFSLSDNYFIHVGPICQSLIQRGVIDVSNNCIPGLPFQRSVEECAYFFAHPRFCSYMESYTYIPCNSKSTRAKPLHWTSCLKIAEDVAQGLSYIHQAWRLVHGNLKSSNVLLGSDFEACVTDYCLSVLATNPPQWEENPDSAAYKAPETRHSNHPQTPKSDVYAYGILLVELLTGRPPSQHLVSAPPSDMMEWARSMREESDPDVGSEDSENSINKMGMLLEVAIACSSASPEQRPTMWQVLKQLQEIKETVSMPEAETELMGSCPGG